MKKLPAKAILLAAASLGMALNASAATYTQNFTFPNGTNTFADGSTLTTAGGTPASVQGNALELTNVNNFGTTNSFNMPALANSSLGFTMSFDVTLIDTAGGLLPADGFSINYGSFAPTAAYGEDGPGAGISWIVDTWDNATGDQGIRSRINGVNDFVQNFAPLADGATVSTNVILSWNPTNGMSLSIAALGGAVFTNRPTPGFVASDANIFGFGARTGNATETVLIDNINITTVPEASTVLLAGIAGLGLMSVRRRK